MAAWLRGASPKTVTPLPRREYFLGCRDCVGSIVEVQIGGIVKSVQDGAVVVSILQIPMREQYLNIWMGSGHIERGPGDSFLLDPCSAWIETWEEMDRATTAHEAE